MKNDIFEKIELHKKRLSMALNDIQSWKTLDSSVFEDLDRIK